MLNRKTSFVLTFILAIVLFLAGCATQAASESAAAQAPAAQPQAAPTNLSTAAEAPTNAPQEAPAATVSFADDVLPILQSRCVRCHGEDRVEKELLLRTYDEIMAGSENGPVIMPGDPANSKLVELVTSQKMPKRGPKLTPPQVQIITEWVAAGAPNN